MRFLVLVFLLQITLFSPFVFAHTDNSAAQAKPAPKEILENHPLGDKIKIFHKPIVIDSTLYLAIQEGMHQRAAALHLFFKDVVLGDAKVFKDIIPESLVDRIFREHGFDGLTDIRRLWKYKNESHITFLMGSDIVFDENGIPVILEDNIGLLGGLADTPFIRWAFENAHGINPQPEIDPSSDFQNIVAQFIRATGLTESDIANGGLVLTSPDENRFDPDIETDTEADQESYEIDPNADYEFLREVLLFEQLTGIGPSQFPGNIANLWMKTITEMPEYKDVVDKVKSELKKDGTANGNSTQVYQKLMPTTYPFILRCIISIIKKKCMNLKAIFNLTLFTENEWNRSFYRLLFSGRTRFLFAPGVEALDHKALLPYVEKFIEFYLGEEPFLAAAESQIISSISGPYGDAEIFPKDWEQRVLKKGTGSQGNHAFLLHSMDEKERFKTIAAFKKFHKKHLAANTLPPLYTSQKPVNLKKLDKEHDFDIRVIAASFGSHGIFVGDRPWGRVAKIGEKKNVSQNAYEGVVYVSGCEKTAALLRAL